MDAHVAELSCPARCEYPPEAPCGILQTKRDTRRIKPDDTVFSQKNNAWRDVRSTCALSALAHCTRAYNNATTSRDRIATRRPASMTQPVFHDNTILGTSSTVITAFALETVPVGIAKNRMQFWNIIVPGACSEFLEFETSR